MACESLSCCDVTAAVLHTALDIQVEQRSISEPGPGQAQVKVMATGLCGSDLHYYQHGRNGDFKVRAPLCLGHESSGIVTAVGPPLPRDPSEDSSALDKTHPLNRPLQVGQRVAIEAGMMCRTCDYCRSGRYNLCTSMSFRSSAKSFPHADGTLQSHVNHPVSLLHPIPDEVPYSLGAMAEPLSVILHATRRARMITEGFHSPSNPVRPTIAIFGAGTIGLLAAALAKSSHYSIQASRIVLLDINPARLAYASEHGFVKPEDTFLLPMPKREQVASWSADEKIQHARDNIASALEKFGIKHGVDCVYECTGAEPCIQMGIFASRPGGRLLTIGMGSTTITTPLLSAATREVDVIGVFRYSNTYPEATQLLSGCDQMRRKLDKLITHEFGLERATEAFELLGRGKGEDGSIVLKVMVGPVSASDSDSDSISNMEFD